MKLVLGRNFSREFDVIEQITIMNQIESNLNNYFLNRHYGDRINQIYIGIICVSKGFDPFFPLSDKIKLNRNPPEIEYGVKLDFDIYRNLPKEQKIIYTYSEILKRSVNMLSKKTINDFDKDSFIKDLEEFVSKNTNN